MNRTPRDIETKFRQSLGAIGPLMCLAEIASKELANMDASDLNNLVKEYEHKKLKISHIELSDVSLYVNLAHIAYINSRADHFCDEVIEFNKKETEKKNKKDKEITGKATKGKNKNKQSYNIDSIDFLRKAVFLVHARNKKLKYSTTKLDESVYIEYLGQEEIWIIDYYRKLRNIEFHGGVSENEPPLTLDGDQKKKIYKKYKFSPNEFMNLTVRDVILYSQAWQAVAVLLCSKIVEIDQELLSRLTSKYKNSSEERRNNALRQKLAQDYLQPDHVVSTLAHQGWVA